MQQIETLTSPTRSLVRAPLPVKVFPRARSQRAGLSGFLTGVDVTDPVNSATVRHMHDLDRRAVDLHSLVSFPVISQLGFQPTGRTH